MVSEMMQKAINSQVNAEIWSSYLYLSMSFCSERLGFKGSEHWFRKQYEEEMEHALRFVEYLQKQNCVVMLQQIPSVPYAWNELRDLYKNALEHEKKVTSMIRSLCELAEQEKDYTTSVFLQWFVLEQLEEEESVQEVVDRLNMIYRDTGALLNYDRLLGSR